MNYEFIDFFLTAFTAIEGIKKPSKFFSDETTEFFFEYLHGDIPRSVEPLFPFARFAFVMFMAIDRIKKR